MHQHAHHQPHPHSDDPGKGGRLLWAFVLNTVFAIIELVGGLYTGSLAVLSDALHDAGDSLSLGLAWWLQRLARRPADRVFTYGYGRFNLLGSVLISGILVAGAIVVLSKAIPGLWNPGTPNAEGMLILAVVGISINGLAFYILRGGRGMNERAVALHLLEDVLGWVAVLLGAGAMAIWGIPWVDPLLSIGISLFVLYNAIKNLWESGRILLQATPRELSTAELEGALLKLPEVQSVHDLHLWSLDGQRIVGSVHVVHPSEMHAPDARHALKERVREAAVGHGVHHFTIELEAPEDVCLYEDQP